MTSESFTQHFGGSLGCLTARDIASLATQLSLIPGLSAREREIAVDAASGALEVQLHRKLARMLLVELANARVKGRLKGATPQERWQDFLATSSKEEFWAALTTSYPTMRARVDRLSRNLLAASLSLAQRWAADRDALAALCGGGAGELTAISFGAGDTHRGGQTVAIVSCGGGKVVYKPRPVAVDAALDRFVAEIAERSGHSLWMRVPRVVDRGAYGWAEFIPHAYAANREELASFYEGIGHWLAVLRVIGGVDFHAENLIAHGLTPVIVDCETLFAPRIPGKPSGYGDATDVAIQYAAGTVLATGLLPSRAKGLGWRGADVSGIGALPGQQPGMKAPDIVNAGTDEARIAMVPIEAPATKNHPSASPSLVDHWPAILSGFSTLSETLRALDRDGDLERMLAPFEDCRVRVVVRATEPYAEIARMLWHPVSLHDENAAKARAKDLFTRMAANVPMAPSDPNVIDAEIEDLLVGDIPYFSTIARDGALEGPGGTRWLAPGNLVQGALQRWRDADLALEEVYMRAALVSAYMEDDWIPPDMPTRPAVNRLGDLDARRRRQAALVMEKLVSTAIRGRDGTATWIAPILLTTGWTTQALSDDLYNGIAGIAVVAAAYLRECEKGRADLVPGVEELLAGLTKGIDAFAQRAWKVKNKQPLKVRPQPAGCYLGIGSQIWSRLLLSELGAGAANGVELAAALAREELPESVAADEINDVLKGSAGAIPALLALFAKTADPLYLRMAENVGDVLCERAKREGDRAWWAYPAWPGGMGGLVHGVTGIGWALHRLADSSGQPRHREIAQAAFAFEDSLFDPEEKNWIDLRKLPGAPKTAASWCHGAVGIGLARRDLDPELNHESTRTSLRHAAEATWKGGWGWNHCACHGDMSAWELIDAAIAAKEGPKDLTREDLLSFVLTGIEERGGASVMKDSFVPGLLPGAAGIAYQLLRADPAASLPSFLLPGKLHGGLDASAAQMAPGIAAI